MKFAEAGRVRAVVVSLMFAIAGTSCVRTVYITPVQNLALRGFIAHAEENWPATPQQQAQTADTLDWLASAIQSLATTKSLTVADLSTKLQAFRASIKEFAAGKPDNPEQPRTLQRMFVDGASLVDELLAASHLDRATAVSQAAEALDLNQPLQRQPRIIERYFREVSGALQRVDRGA